MRALWPWLPPVAVLLVSALAGYLLETRLPRLFKQAFRLAQAGTHEALLATMGGFLEFWVILAAAAAAIQISPLSPQHQTLACKLIVAGFFVSITLALSRLLSKAIELYSEHFGASATAAGLSSNLVQIGVMGMGALLLLSNLGISITPLLTALGVGSLAVALALQDTLINFFAGIHIVATRMVEVGDYIKLDSGHEGIVLNVGWRGTRMRELADNTILVPNSKLSQAIIINYHKPAPETAVPVPFSVCLDCDLEQVERVVRQAAARTQRETPGAVQGFEPLLRFQGLTDSSVQLAVVLRARSFQDRFLLIHECAKAVQKALREAGIPFPRQERLVHLRRERSG